MRKGSKGRPLQVYFILKLKRKTTGDFSTYMVVQRTYTTYISTRLSTTDTLGGETKESKSSRSCVTWGGGTTGMDDRTIRVVWTSNLMVGIVVGERNGTWTTEFGPLSIPSPSHNPRAQPLPQRPSPPSNPHTSSYPKIGYSRTTIPVWKR